MFDPKTWLQRVVHEAVLAHGNDTAAIEAYVEKRKAELDPADREAVDHLQTIGFYAPSKPFDIN